MKYLLDSDTLIDYIKDHGDTRAHLNALINSGDDVALCAITVAEIYSGLADKARRSWQLWLEELPYWNITPSAAQQAGIDRKAASETGRTLQLTDALIAALAREQQATILTSNIKDYPHPGNRVMSLREEAA